MLQYNGVGVFCVGQIMTIKNYHIAFWNLENLFAPEGHVGRIDWLAKRIKNDLKGWSDALFKRKLWQLTQVIVAMNDGHGPDVLGVCEVENRFVLDELLKVIGHHLPARDYGVIHADNMRDRRGIDTAFIYDRDKLSINEDEFFSHFVLRRTGTRDISQVTFTTPNGNEFVAMCNHWPSRSGGTAESAGFRQTAGETVAYWHARIREEKGDDVALIVMGDFNDDPEDMSVKLNARATRARPRVSSRRSVDRLYNLTDFYRESMIEAKNGRNRRIYGTLYYKGFPNLFDQIWVSRGFLSGTNAWEVDEDTAKIEAIPDMVNTSSSKGPIRFGLPRGKPEKNINQDGYSDHFPVSVIIRENIDDTEVT